MEPSSAVPVPRSSDFSSNAASILISGNVSKIAYLANSTAGSEGSASCQVTIATLAVGANYDDIIANLPAGCSNVCLLQRRQPHQSGDSDSNSESVLLGALVGKSIEPMHSDYKAQHLKGLAIHWYSGQRPDSIWLQNPPPCTRQVSHSPSWSLINDRLGRRIRRHDHEPQSGAADGPVIVAELGAHEMTLHKFDSHLTVTKLTREPYLGYKNLMGLARLSPVPCGAATLEALLESAAEGSLAKLDLTIGDLLPAESTYGQYDLGIVVFALGKLHDLKSLDQLKPSPSDVAASLTYTFIKTFFDVIVHATSAHGIPRVIVVGEFFQSESCRKRLFEAWNFTGVPKDALSLHFLRSDANDLMALTGGLLM